MLITKLTSEDPAHERAKWKIVMRDSFADVEGIILSADPATGAVSLQMPDNSVQHFTFPAYSFAIVRRGR